MAATDALLAAALATDPAGPLITYYDDEADGRVELSATTLANWVAKTANLLQDEFGVEPGAPVTVRLPAHWQTAAILLAGWAVGAVLGTEPAGAEVSFVRPGEAGDADGEVVSCPLSPLGMPEPAPPGAVDYARVTLAQPDVFVPYVPVPEDATAVAGATGAQLLERARARASAWGIEANDRILLVGDWSDPAGWVDGLLAPLAAGTSIVLCARPRAERLAERAAAEKITATAGVSVPGVRALAP